jgi:hypothetical protein
MDWARAIERNRDALTGIVAALFAMLGLQDGGSVGRIERALHRAVLRVLRPAESAVRRLIVIAARGLVVKPSPARPMPKGRVIKRGGGAPRLSFQLFDPRKNFAPRRRYVSERFAPRVLFYWNEDGELVSPPRQPPPPDDGRVDAGRLCRRLLALKMALADLPRQAKRLVRARARRAKVPRLQLQSPMRPGHPPGYRKNPVHEVDDVLFNCHLLARDAERLDTS